MENEAICEAEITINSHNERRRYEIEDKAHGVGMLLVDILQWCDANGVDFDLELETARDTLSDLRA